MIAAHFNQKNGCFYGFSISGHAGWADSGKDIVCAAVTSAVQLVANGITEVQGINADVQVLENTIALTLQDQTGKASQWIAALHLHLTLLSEEYENTLNITVSEV